MGSNRSRAYGTIAKNRAAAKAKKRKRLPNMTPKERAEYNSESREGGGKSWESGAGNRSAAYTFRRYGGQIVKSKDPTRKDKRWFKTREKKEAYPFCICEVFCPKCDLDKEKFECQCTVPCAKHRWGLP